MNETVLDLELPGGDDLKNFWNQNSPEGSWDLKQASRRNREIRFRSMTRSLAEKAEKVGSQVQTHDLPAACAKSFPEFSCGKCREKPE